MLGHKIKHIENHLNRLFTTQSQLPTINNPEEKKPFENIVGKGENAGNKHFLLFPQCFSILSKTLVPNLVAKFVVCYCFQFGPTYNFVMW